MKQIKRMALGILFCCATLYCAAQSVNKATLYIVRTSGLGPAVNFKYFIDDQFVGKMNFGKYFKLEVEPGEHIIWAKAENRSFVHATLLAGETYLIDARPQMGALKAGVILEAVNSPTEKEMAKIKKSILKGKLIEYDENKKKLEQQDFAGFIEKSLSYYNEKVKDSEDDQKLSEPIEL